MKNLTKHDDKSIQGISRRRFIQTAAIAATGAALPVRSWGDPSRSGNVHPGKIVIWEDRDATSGSSVNLSVVKSMVENSLMALTGESTALAALESLLPDLDATKKVTFKVNTLGGNVPTRWEMVRAVTDLLLQTVGGTFPASNITIFDNRNIAQFGYDSTNFPGVNIALRDPDPGTTIELDTGDYWPLSSHIVNCEYLINCPILKNHSQSDKRWTLGFKNHVGSVGFNDYECGCHTPNPRLLNISASPHIRDKTKLILLSAIHGAWQFGPGGYPMDWNLFPNPTPYNDFPNAVILSTDPVTSEHWGIELINQERATHSGTTVYSLPYCEDAAGSPWNLGIYPFSEHEVITNLPAPANLSAQRGPTGVALSWSSVTGASKYRVYRSTDPYFVPDTFGESNLLTETTATSFTDIGAGSNPDANSYYVVRAYRAIWESSDSPRVAAFFYEAP